MSEIQKQRTFFTKTNRQLRKARSLYAAFCRQAIALDRTGQTLDICARRMMKSGMYSDNQCHRHVKYALLRTMWRWDRQLRLSWHDWCYKNGWTGWYWTRRMNK
jgi:hypothetical protein